MAAPSMTAPVAPRPPETVAAINDALAALPATYQPRTRHLDDRGRPLYSNRLLLATSPYLLQHAHNPVDWHPWGDEVFALATRLDRPVLLSVGYSTCHWCHVMEEESFENETIAALMNRLAVPVKVDREERPDVDSTYMTAVQLQSGHGGWPMTVWMTPDRRPFYCATYLPPVAGARGARLGFAEILQELDRLWREDRPRLLRAAEELTRLTGDRLALGGGAPAGGGPHLPEAALIDRALAVYSRDYDEDHGGLGTAPKFPSSLPVRLLLDRFRRTREPGPLAMAERTLGAMAAGGLQDQIGGGFHRYCVDERWLVPHFEKMLYDNALLAMTYQDAFVTTGDAAYRVTAERTLDYLIREMRDAAGGFYSATDADSPNPERGMEREEGWFFTWTPAELERTLGRDHARVVAAWFEVDAAGNFEGRTVLSTPHDRAAVARRLELAPAELDRIIGDAAPRMLAARATRPPPLLDDKVIAAWNGLALSALARCGFAFDRPDYVAAASDGAGFVRDRMQVDGRLRRIWRQGRTAHHGTLDDYAAMAAAALDLTTATGEVDWLVWAESLCRAVETWFGDPGAGGYYLMPADAPPVLAREKPFHDQAVPSGNSLMAMNLLRLAALTGDDGWRAKADRCLSVCQPLLTRYPAACGEMLLALSRRHAPPVEIVLVGGDRGDPVRAEMVGLLRQVPSDAATVLCPDRNQAAAWLEHCPLPVRDRLAPDGKARVYVCVDRSCQAPVLDANALAACLAHLGMIPMIRGQVSK